jgi:ABC-type bacteriocin/lantibiotic exporter with double-glycine peptidase domain
VDVYYPVAGMSQPTDHSCRATSFAVVINYRDGSNLSPADVSNAVGVDISAVESWSDVTNAAEHFGLQESASACMNVQGWTQMLMPYGPLWICASNGGHAVVVNGAQGDGTEDGTIFYVTDPWSGPETLSLNGLNALFEAVGAAQPGDGLVIWHA